MVGGQGAANQSPGSQRPVRTVRATVLNRGSPAEWRMSRKAVGRRPKRRATSAIEVFSTSARIFWMAGCEDGACIESLPSPEALCMRE